MPTSNRKTAIQTARYYCQLRPVYLDTETTGLDDYAEIVEICILDSDSSLLVNSLVKPKHPVSPQACRIHGITNSMLENAPTWPQLWPRVQAALDGRFVGIYNAEFDLRMFKQSHGKYGQVWGEASLRSFCIMKLYAQYYGAPSSAYGPYRYQALEAAGRQCGISLPNAHRAQADTLLARAVLNYMAGCED